MRKTINLTFKVIFSISLLFTLLPRPSFASMLSDMTLGDSVSLHERLALIEGVALGDGFSLVDGAKGIKLWDMVTVRPMSRIAFGYDSNTFLDKDDPKGDFITTFDVGMEGEMKLGRVNIMAGYVFDMNLFAKHDDQNNFNHTAIAKANWQLTNYDLIIEDKYKNFSDRSGTEDVERVHRAKNILSADLITTGFDKLQLDTGYDFIIEDYISDDLLTIGGRRVSYKDAQSRFEHVFREEVSYRFMPKTSFLIESDFGWIDYFHDYRPSSYFIQALAGLKGEIFKESVATLKAGFRFQDYDNDNYMDYANLVFRGDIAKKFGVKNTVSLYVERSVNESTYDDMNYYVLNHIGLGYVYQHNDKLSAHFATSYQLNQYPSATVEDGVRGRRYDNFYTVACGLRYDIRQWLTTAIAYQWTDRHSKFSKFDYIDNYVAWSMAVQF